MSKASPATSVANHLQTRAEVHEKPRKESGCCKNCLKHFSLNGPFNYAFIYGSWEIIRARKVGTTHTVVDYVVYRLFFVVILVGIILFELVKEKDLFGFFSSSEIWAIILQLVYGSFFLQNVLENNLHRENVKHRQKIPERLIVIDEIEKGGHKFYIYKRNSILPTDMLYNMEKTIYVLYTTTATVNASLVAGIIAGHYAVGMLRFMALMLSLADVAFAAIPLRLLHVVFPLCFFTLYAGYMHVVSKSFGEIKTSYLKFTTNIHDSLVNYLFLMIDTCIIHAILVGLSVFRDFIISLLDDSKTAKQQESLRSQKRLARRKLMNFVEDESGRITGITLEKHSIADLNLQDEFIATDRDAKRKPQKVVLHEDEEEEESNSSTSAGKERASVKLTEEIKPPPHPRYPIDNRKPFEMFSSSSSDLSIQKKEDNELEAIKDIQFPSPPNAYSKVDAETEMGTADADTEEGKSKKSKSSKIPLAFHRLGKDIKPRDSKEKLEIERRKRDESPSTPPFVSLVQTMMQTKRDTKTKKVKDAETLVSMIPPKYIRLMQREYEMKKKEELLEQRKEEFLAKARENYKPRLSRSRIVFRKSDDGQTSSKGEQTGSGDRVVASKIIDLNSKPRISVKPPPGSEEKYKKFHAELTAKLLKERGKQKKEEFGRQDAFRKRPAKPNERQKSILISFDDENRQIKSKKRQQKIIKRRKDRSSSRKRGKPVYDQLVAPNISHVTSYHFLGSKYKNFNEETQIKEFDLPLYRKHPGLGTVADVTTPDEKEDGAKESKSLVTFHPVVRFFDVNEVQQDAQKNLLAKKAKPK